MLGFGQGSGVGETDLERVLRERKKVGRESACMQVKARKNLYLLVNYWTIRDTRLDKVFYPYPNEIYMCTDRKT